MDLFKKKGENDRQFIFRLGRAKEQGIIDLDWKQLTEIFNRTDDVSIEKVGMELSNLKDYIYGYEVDSGKSDILTGKIDINFAWSGDAVYTIDEGEDAGLNLGYIVPEEGSNVWFDGWVMPKAAKEAQALEFLNFLCEPENAVRNMDYIGYTSCVAGDEVFEYAYGSFTAESEVIDVASYNELDDELKAEYGLYNGEYYCAIDVDEEENNIYGVLAEDALGVYLETFSLDAGVKVNVKREEVYKTDLKYFFDKNDTTGKYVIYSLDNDRQLFAQYANEEVIRRCAVMKQFDNETLEKINAMWNREKLITLPTYALILFGVAVVALIIVYFLVKFRAKIFKRNIPKTETQSNKNGMKVISKEML